MKRLLGLLLILVIVFPLFFGLGGLLVASDMLGQLQATVTRRVDTISAQLSQTEATINAVSARFDNLESVADQVSAAARAASQAIAVTMSDTTAHYDGVIWPAGTPSPSGLSIPNIPAANLAVPGISSARGFLQNLYDMLASFSGAVAEVTTINQVPGVFGQAVSETQALAADLDALSASYSPLLLFLLIGFGLWLAIIYALLVLKWLKQGWGMLLGRTV